MVVDMEIAAGPDLQIEEAVAREALEHVVEERHPGRDLAASAAVELERERDLRLAGLALDSRRSAGACRLPRVTTARLVPLPSREIFGEIFGFRLRFFVSLIVISPAAQLHRARVALESFHPRQMRHRRTELSQPRPATPRLYWFA